MRKEAKLSAREIPGVKEGEGEEALLCNSLFCTLCTQCGFEWSRSTPAPSIPDSSIMLRLRVV